MFGSGLTMEFSLTVALVLIATSVTAAFMALCLLAAVQGRRTPLAQSVLNQPDAETVFMFDDQILVDASDAAHDFLAAGTAPGAPWGRLCALLSLDFPGFEGEMQKLEEIRRVVLSGVGETPITLLAEWRAGLTRITLTGHGNDGQDLSVDRLSYKAMDQELSGLRATLDAAPILVWREGKGGAVTWANRAYLETVAARDGDDYSLTWPLPRLFDAEAMDTAGAKLSRVPAGQQRARIAITGEKNPRWYDCHSFPEADGFLHFAVPANAAVQAERALREFIQTLTKTFAHLPIGLAIFDRQRQLALFNPALIDLTGLGADFLSARPTLFGFLDRLREERRMPEPKNYKQWRQQMLELERAASSGQYEEIWTLPSGQTYRVTGRPHPEGATALLFEDISAEMSLTRRFRAELELGQAVIDSLPDAIAVFSPAGVLVQSNAAYARLWGQDPIAILGQVGISEALQNWQALGKPSPCWGRLRDYVGMIADRSHWQAEVGLKDGRVLICRAMSIMGESTLIGFTAVSPRELVLPARRRLPPRAARTRLIGEQAGQQSDSHETA